MAISKPWEKPGIAPSEKAQACPALTLRLLASSPVSGTVLRGKPPSFWYSGTAVPGNSCAGVGV